MKENFWPEVSKVESSKDGVKVEFNTGVVLHLNANPGSIHISLSGVEVPVKLGHAHINLPVLETSNYFDIMFTSIKKD